MSKMIGSNHVSSGKPLVEKDEIGMNVRKDEVEYEVEVSPPQMAFAVWRGVGIDGTGSGMRHRANAQGTPSCVLPLLRGLPPSSWPAVAQIPSERPVLQRTRSSDRRDDGGDIDHGNDETRQWTIWADWLGVPAFTFLALIGALIARGEDHRRVFHLLRPDFNWERERAAQVAAGVSLGISAIDLYPDALPCLEALRAEGYQLGLAGNQPAEATPLLGALGLPVDWIAPSADWGVEKPSPAFFARLIQEVGYQPEEIAYVGDRVDTDVAPARAAGMLAIFVHRGPWGYAHALHGRVDEAAIRLELLVELPQALKQVTLG
jgi:FMN phosphatase YigB (HAD superfamily)